MDKKNTIIGLLLLIVAFAWMNWEQNQLEEEQAKYEEELKVYEENQARKAKPTSEKSPPVFQKIPEYAPLNPIRNSNITAVKPDSRVPEKIEIIPIDFYQ